MQKILTNDLVLVSSGKDKGRKGKVKQVLQEEGLVVVEGANKVYRHVKPRRRGEKGQRIEVNGPIQLANVRLICPVCNKPTRVGFTKQGSGETLKKVRLCRRCKKVIAKKVQSKKK